MCTFPTGLLISVSDKNMLLICSKAHNIHQIMEMVINVNLYMYVFIYLLELLVFQIISLEGESNNLAYKKNKSK